MTEEKKLEIENNINRKLLLIKKTLKNIEEIFILFKPLFEKIIELEESEEFIRDGSFLRVSSLFGEISKDFKEMGGLPISKEFLESLLN